MAALFDKHRWQAFCIAVSTFALLLPVDMCLFLLLQLFHILLINGAYIPSSEYYANAFKFPDKFPVSGFSHHEYLPFLTCYVFLTCKKKHTFIEKLTFHFDFPL